MPDIQLNELVEINPLRPKIDLNPMDEVSFIPMSDVSESGRWINHQSRRFGDVSRSYTYFEEGDVLFAKITPCMENGKGCYPRNLVNGIGFASTEFHVIRAKENADASFLYQWSIYKPLRLKASATMIGSAGQQRVPTSFLESFKVPAIAKQEQIKIAEILSTVDQAIDQTESLVAKQQRIKTGLMQDLLTRGITWSTCKLREVADVRVSNVDKKTHNAETPIKLCNYMDVYANDYVTASINFMAGSASKSEIDRFGLQAGDVVITKDSETPDDIGVPAVVTDSIDGLVCGYHLALIRPRNGAIDSIYLAKQISSATGRPLLRGLKC